jgi:hypothetical protein
VNKEKYMHLQCLKEGQTFKVTFDPEAGDEGVANVSFDEVHVLKKGTKGAVVCLKGEYAIIALHDCENPLQQPPHASAAAAVVGYWAVGPDAE